jgi:threonine dehydrogenase-like Zn-dependent dehydrogenase
MGAERIIAMSRHETRQNLGREFGATDIVTERGDDGATCVMDMTNGVGADLAVECVGAQESMMQAIRSTRSGGYIGFAGVSHGVQQSGEEPGPRLFPHSTLC